MSKPSTNKEKFMIDKLLILLAVICITFAILIIGLYFSNTEIFASKPNQMKTNYTSTEDNKWDVSESGDESVIAILDDNGVLTISGLGKMKNYNSPTTVPWYNVTNQIKSVKIEDGVTSVSEWAFYKCNSLTNVNISGSVTNVGNFAFEYCDNLMSVEMLEGVITIGNYTFASCDKLTNIKMPDSLISIGNCAFQYCRRLKNIEIPAGVTEIGKDPFDNCLALTSIDVDENNLNYKDDRGVLYTKDETQLIRYPEGRNGSEYTILSGVTSISNYAFANVDSLSSIKIPVGVTSIGDYAFEYSNLKTIEIDSTVTNIGEGAFNSTWNLTNIEVNSSNNVYCDVDGVLYTKDRTKIIAYPIGRTETEYTILNSVIDIGDNAFDSCNLRSIKIPDGVRTIGKNAFSFCYNLKYIEIPNSVTSIGDYAFEACDNLESIVIPSDIITIGNCPFLWCQVINVISADDNIIEIPNILKRTQDETDILYSSQELILENCVIENGEIKINEEAPYASIEVDDGKLEGLKYIITYTTWDISKTSDESIIATLDDNGTLNISGSGDMKDYTYFEEIPWYALILKIKDVKINEGISRIGTYAFAGGENIRSIDIPDSVTRIGNAAFMSCYSLESIRIPRGVATIGAATFEDCFSLLNINVDSNNTVYTDEDGVLYTKDKTKIIKYPSGRTETEYEILNTVQTIGENAFRFSYLTNIEIPDSVTKIEYEAFGYCYDLKGIKIPKSVERIDAYAFDWCYNLTIFCYEDSYAETYAQSTNIAYRLIHLNSIEQEIDEINLFIKNIQPKSEVQELKTSLQSDISYSILDFQENEIQDVSSILKTGYKIKLENNTIYTIIVTGDADGDGQANIDDILAINKHRLNKAPLTSEYLEAADVDGNGVADISDILQINKFRLGKTQTL